MISRKRFFQLIGEEPLGELMRGLAAGIKDYWKALKVLAEQEQQGRKMAWECREKAWEARELLRALRQPAYGPPEKITLIVMNIGLAHLRAVKCQLDAARATREMELRIKEGPRPSYVEASLN